MQSDGDQPAAPSPPPGPPPPNDEDRGAGPAPPGRARRARGVPRQKPPPLPLPPSDPLTRPLTGAAARGLLNPAPEPEPGEAEPPPSSNVPFPIFAAVEPTDTTLAPPTPPPRDQPRPGPVSPFATIYIPPDQPGATNQFATPPVSPLQQPRPAAPAAPAPPVAGWLSPTSPGPPPPAGPEATSNETPPSVNLARHGPSGPAGWVSPPGGITSVSPAGSTPVPSGATPWGSAERAAIIERLAATPRALAPPIPVPDPASRSARGATAAVTGAAALIGSLGGTTILQGMLDRAERPWLAELISVQFFAHWTTRPASFATGPTDASQAALWISRDGPATGARLVPDEAMVHWLMNLGRIALLLVGIGVGVRLVLQGQRNGTISRTLASWAAVGGAAAFAGAVSSVAFTQLSQHESMTVLSALVDGAGFGAQWALLVGLPLGLLASVMARNAPPP